MTELILTDKERARIGEIGMCSCGCEGAYVINPYHEEIYGDEILECMCDDCYQNACDDV